MRVDWRSLFDNQRIEWRDRGANTSAGNVSIACPWCGNDPSFHLAVAEEREAFYCYREPNRHSGTNAKRLLIALRVPYAQVTRLLNQYNFDRGRPTRAAPPVAHAVDGHRAGRIWDRFVTAERSAQGLSYLAMRGFVDGAKLIRTFDLRVAEAGQWAHRLLIPYVENNEVISWTGRAFGDRPLPRYLTQNATDSGLVYAPARPNVQAAYTIIVEGPIDALKIAAAVDLRAISVIALTGLALPAAKLARLQRLTKGCKAVMVALDADAAVSTAYQIIADIAQVCDAGYIGRLRLPPKYKDPAELPLTEITPWLLASPFLRI